MKYAICAGYIADDDVTFVPGTGEFKVIQIQSTLSAANIVAGAIQAALDADGVMILIGGGPSSSPIAIRPVPVLDDVKAGDTIVSGGTYFAKQS